MRALRLAALLALLPLTGCDFNYGFSIGRSVPRADDGPILVIEHDGVRLWRVRDRTRGGSAWVYFASPATRPTVVGEAGERVPSAIDGR